MTTSLIDVNSLVPGQILATLDKGVISTAHIMRWSAAVENFHRIHYDHAFATGHDKLPGILINGSWKQHVLVQLVKVSLGSEGWLWRLRFRYKKMDLAGDALRAVSQVVHARTMGDLVFITLAVQLVNHLGEISTAGHAIGVLPAHPGVRVPYPFVPQDVHREIDFSQDD